MKIAFVLFPNLTQLDFTGPLQFLARMPGAETQLLARTMEPVPSDCGLSLMPTGTFAAADDEIDLLCIPGGFGVSGAIEDPELMDFVRRAGAKANWHTSVCTGAFVLGAAGLLQGKRATTHWAYHELLSKVGAIPTQGRVVRDGQVITGGGVTAGIDFALQLVAELEGPELAQSLQLGMEYDPQPPFDVGSPARAPAPLTEKLRGVYAKRRDEFAAQLDRLS
jgi:cyclohexyl-isocyanide hydratase